MKKLSLQLKITLFYSAVFSISCLIITLASIEILKSSIKTVTLTADQVTSDYMTRSLPNFDLNKDDHLIFVENKWSKAFKPLRNDVSSCKENELRELRETFTTTALQLQNEVQTAIVSVMVGVVGVGGILIYHSVGYFIRPINEISKTIENIDEMQLSMRLAEQKSPETRRLSNSVNIMMKKLDKAFAKQKRFTSDVAHELKTPLACIQVNLDTIKIDQDVTLDEAMEVLEITQRNVRRLISLTENLLQLHQKNVVLRVEECDLVEIFCQIEEGLQPILEQKQLQLICDQKRKLVCQNRQLLYRVLFNLIDNAVKYSPPRSKISVDLEVGKLNQITISNPCEFIADEDMQQIFEAFYRIDSSRTRDCGGAGLGLAICKEIMNQLNGTIQARYHEGLFLVDVLF